jgi:hypothetical protein
VVCCDLLGVVAVASHGWTAADSLGSNFAIDKRLEMVRAETL